MEKKRLSDHGGVRKGAGRPTVYGKKYVIPIRVPDTWKDIIPCNRCEYIREAVREKLARDGLIEKVEQFF